MTRRAAPPRPFLVGVLTGGAVTAAWVTGQRTDPGSVAADRWTRQNFRGRDVTLRLGPAIGIGAVAGVSAAGPSARRNALAMVATTAAVGVYDDLYGDRHARGLGGHLRALRAGRVTTGLVKLVTLTAAAAASSRRQHDDLVDVALGTVLVAGGANLVNLFDLRPGRAAKVSLLAAASLSRSGDRDARAIAAVAAGAAVAALPADLGERAMVGDAGAGVLGAVLGWSASLGTSRRRRALLAGGVIALTAASERVSFSQVIEHQPALRALDGLGRQPA